MTPRGPAAGLPARLLLLPVLAYRLLLRPVLGPPRCRFTPSCSAYAADALRAHGALRGTGLAVWRVLRCNPFQTGGHDPVPAHTRTGADRREG